MAERRKEASHERDERSTAVDQYCLKHLHTPSSSSYAAIDYSTQLSEKSGLPAIEVSYLQGKFLALQCQMIDAKNVLELGTLGGTSSIWMAMSGPEVKVTTIEVDPEHKKVAEQAIAHAGLSERITVHLGAGLDVLPQIHSEVTSNKRPLFDLVFIDADKENNLAYYDYAIRMCRSRACIIVDNVVRSGKLADDEVAKKDSRIQGARKVIEAAGRDERLMGATVIQTVGEKNYDGFLMCVVK